MGTQRKVRCAVTVSHKSMVIGLCLSAAFVSAVLGPTYYEDQLCVTNTSDPDRIVSAVHNSRGFLSRSYI